MTMGSLLLIVSALIALVSASIAVATGRDERARARWMLATSVALASVFALIGAVPLALALLFIAAGQGLITLHAIDVVEALDAAADTSPAPLRVAPSHWLLIVLGIGGGVWLANVTGTAVANTAQPNAEEALGGVAAGFADVASVVLVEHGFATILVALLLLAVSVAAGFLAVRESD